jgi:hypothetical protein
MMCGEGTLASPTPCSRVRLPPPGATQASPPHIHPTPAPTGQLHPSSFFPSLFLHLTPIGRNELRPYSRRHLFAHQRAQLGFELCPALLVHSLLYLTSFVRFIKLQQFL